MSEELKDLIKRVADLEGEVGSLKQQLREMRSPQLVAKEQLKPVRSAVSTESARQVAAPKVKPAAPPTVSVERQPRKEFNLEQALSAWLPRVFMFILLLGVLWGLKVGMDKGFITNPVRVGMGYAGTALLYFLGMRYYGSGKKGFGLTLLGGFIGLGILTTFAAHHLYGYLNFTWAFLVGVAYIIAGLLLSRKTKSETLTLFSAIAGFLLPFLLEGEGATAIQFCSYILLLFLSLFYVSLSQHHKYSFYVTFVLFHLTLLTYGILDGASGDETIFVGTVLVQHLALLVFYLKGSISRSVFSEVLLYTNFVFTIGWIKLLDYGQEVTVYGLLALLYIALAVYAFRKKDGLLHGVLLAVSVFAVCVFILAFNLEDSRVRLMLLLVNGAVGAWVGLRYDTLRTIFTSAIIYLFASIFVLSTLQFSVFWSLEHAVWLVFLATMGGVFYTLYRYPPALLKGKTVGIDQSLVAGQVVVLLYVNLVTRIGLAHSQVSYGTSLHVQSMVLLVALVAMYFCYRWRRGLYLTSGAVALFLLASFLMLFTSVGAYGVRGDFLIPFFVQLAYAVTLTVMVWAIMQERFFVSQQVLKLRMPMVAVGMQVVYFILLNKWYFAFTAAYTWDLEYVLFVHTFLLFAFAFGSVSFGGKMGWKYVKIVGAVLIGVCVLKLFIVDLASISILVRAILFIIVGIVGLLYSRTLLKE